MNGQLSVLIVDSDPDARECLRDLLESEGYQSMSAPPGQEAWYLLRQADTPCIVLLNKVGRAETGLQFLAILEHEKCFLELALEVMNQDRAWKDMIDLTDNDERPQQECLATRRLFQRAVAQRPIAKLVKTPFEGSCYARAAMKGFDS
jgi:CheY-like chemotaxis protein